MEKLGCKGCARLMQPEDDVNHAFAFLLKPLVKDAATAAPCSSGLRTAEVPVIEGADRVIRLDNQGRLSLFAVNTLRGYPLLTSSNHHNVAPATRFGQIRHAWRTKGWLKPFRSASILAVGRGAQGLLQLAAAAIAAQALGASAFGILVLVNTARQLIGGVAKLRSKHVIMRYGARALEAKDHERFQHVICFALWLDIIGAAIVAAAIGGGMGTFATLLNIPDQYITAARIFGFCAVFVALSTSAEALLRLFDRFDVVSVQQVIAPVIQVAGGALALWQGGGFLHFMAIWFASFALSRLWLIGAALRELHRNGQLAILRLRFRHLKPPEKGLWRFVVGTNLGDALNQIRQNASVLTVGAMLDPAAAGIVRVAREIGSVPGRPTGKVLIPAVSPEIARQTAAAKQQKRHKTVWRSAAIAGGLGLGLFAVLALFGKPLLNSIFGPSFEAAYGVMLLFGVAGVIRMGTFTLSPLLISSGRISAVIAARICATVSQLALLGLLIPSIGYTGTAIAEIVALLASNLILLYAVRQEMRTPRAAN